MQYNTLNYRKVGGAEWVIGGTLTFGANATVTFNGTTISGTVAALTVTALAVTGVTFAAGGSINLDSETKTGNTATSTKMAVKLTTASLTTAAGATQDVVITNSNAVAGDFARAEVAGGTNTRNVIVLKTVVTTNTITATLLNIEASNALNGTVVLDFHFEKA